MTHEINEEYCNLLMEHLSDFIIDNDSNLFNVDIDERLSCDDKKLVFMIQPDAIQTMTEWFPEYVMRLQFHSSKAKFMINDDIMFIIYLIENETDDERNLSIQRLLYMNFIACCVPFVPNNATSEIPEMIWIGDSRVENSVCRPFLL
jgi:hypothetical protein